MHVKSKRKEQSHEKEIIFRFGGGPALFLFVLMGAAAANAMSGNRHAAGAGRCALFPSRIPVKSNNTTSHYEKEEHFMKSKRLGSKLLSLLTVVALVLSFTTVSAFAADNVKLTKYENGNWETITVPENNGQGVPAGTYAAVEIHEGDVVILNQNSDLYLAFGTTKDTLGQYWNTLLKDDGSLKKTSLEKLTYPTEKTSSDVVYWNGTDTNEGSYYYGYVQDGKMYVLASADKDDSTKFKVSHIDVITGINPSTPVDPGKSNKPGMEKEVSESNEEWTTGGVSTAAGNVVNFRLTTNVPTTLGTNYVLTIHDKMDLALTIDPTTVTVQIGNKPLKMADDYTYTTNDLDGCTFEITMVLTELKEKKFITDEDLKNGTPITVTYSATLKKDAKAGCYKNFAWVTSPDGESTHPDADVYTYAIKVYKYDTNTDKPLAGAEFTLKDSEGKTIATGTTGEDGYFTFDGLDAGTYTIVETKAPEGYMDSKTEQTVTIPEDAGTTYTATVKVANMPETHTGGAGTMFYTIGGAAILIAAGALILVSRKSRKQQA